MEGSGTFETVNEENTEPTPPELSGARLTPPEPQLYRYVPGESRPLRLSFMFPLNVPSEKIDVFRFPSPTLEEKKEPPLVKKL